MIERRLASEPSSSETTLRRSVPCHVGSSQSSTPTVVTALHKFRVLTGRHSGARDLRLRAKESSRSASWEHVQSPRVTSLGPIPLKNSAIGSVGRLLPEDCCTG